MDTQVFQVIEINGINAIFTDLHIKRSEVPSGYHAYDIRDSDDGGNFATIESLVRVNHAGTILVHEPIDLGSEGYVEIEDYSFPDESATIIQPLIDAYTARLDAYMLEIEKSCTSKKKNKPKLEMVSPNYIEEVIIPVLQGVADIMLKGKKVKVPNAKTYLPVKEYYRIKVGVTTVGGFSVPDGDDFSIYFTPLKSANPIGEKAKIHTIEQLYQCILMKLDK